jgi:hypothetical protein
MIMNFNFAVWEAVKERVSGQRCLTPHRAAINLHEGTSVRPAAKKARRS